MKQIIHKCDVTFSIVKWKSSFVLVLVFDFDP